MYKIPELFFSYYVTIDFVYETIYFCHKTKINCNLMLSKKRNPSSTDKIFLEMALEGHK